jgi:hypothetical protein
MVSKKFSSIASILLSCCCSILQRPRTCEKVACMWGMYLSWLLSVVNGGWNLQCKLNSACNAESRIRTVWHVAPPRSGRPWNGDRTDERRRWNFYKERNQACNQEVWYPYFFSFLVVILMCDFYFLAFLRCFPTVNVEPLYEYLMTKTAAH